MVEYTILFSKSAEKDKKLLKNAGLDKRAKELFDILMINPYQNPPPFERLRGNLEGCFSRRINYQHRLVYEVDDQNKIIFILRMWTHYEKM